MAENLSSADEATQAWGTGLVLVTSIALGGGQGGLGDLAVQLLALGLLGWLLFRGPPPGRAAWLVFFFLAIPILQSLPIPLSSWLSLGPRSELSTELSRAGVLAQPHLALQALNAERSVWCLLPGAALYISTLSLSQTRQRQMCGLILVMALIGTILGLAQLAGGPESALRFYTNTNRTEAVGFFANRNHMAALLVMSLPLAMTRLATALSPEDEGNQSRALGIAAAIGSIIAIMLSVAIVRSRSGVVLAMLGVFLSAPLFFSSAKRRGAKRLLALAIASSLVLIIQFGLYGILTRLEADPLQDARWKIASVTQGAAAQHAPFGSGLGGFRQVFQASDTATPGSTIVNHAHNDYLELWLEAGWVFAAVGLTFLLVFLYGGIIAWGEKKRRVKVLRSAAFISLLLVLLHSSVDYPLRTTAIQAAFAVLLAVLFSQMPDRTREDKKVGVPAVSH